MFKSLDHARTITCPEHVALATALYDRFAAIDDGDVGERLDAVARSLHAHAASQIALDSVDARHACDLITMSNVASLARDLLADGLLTPAPAAAPARTFEVGSLVRYAGSMPVQHHGVYEIVAHWEAPEGSERGDLFNLKPVSWHLDADEYLYGVSEHSISLTPVEA